MSKTIDAKGTTEPFRLALRKLLADRDEYLTLSGTTNLAEFARELEDEYTYETLRKVMAGARRPTARFMERVALALRIEPTYFAEYRRLSVQKTLSELSNDQVEQLFSMLREWKAARRVSEAERGVRDTRANAIR